MLFSHNMEFCFLHYRTTKVIPLKCDITVEFEFTLSYVQLHPAFTVEPMSGKFLLKSPEVIGRLLMIRCNRIVLARKHICNHL